MNHVHTRLNEIFIYLVPDFLGVRFLIDSFNDTRCHFIVFSDFRFAVRPIGKIVVAKCTQGLQFCTIIGQAFSWCCTIKVDIGNSKGQYIEKDKQEATKDGSESTKIQHGI